jgi:hypothetical protein
MKTVLTRRPALFLWCSSLALLVATVGRPGFHEW